VKYREVVRSIERKVPGGEPRVGRERNCWPMLDGHRVLRVTYPSIHGRADIPKGTLHSIRKQLRLERDDFDRFVACPMTSSEYELHLRTLQTFEQI
jgi:hypothetical protein